jgi:hypothetical protein
MNRDFLLRTGVCALLSVATSGSAAWFDNAGWHDDFYQYRIPFDVESATAGGQYVLPITEQEIVAAVNRADGGDVTYDHTFFAFDNILIVAHDNNGGILGPVPNSGYVIAPASTNKLANPGFEDGSTDGWSISAPADFSVVEGSYNGSRCLHLNSTEVDLGGAFQFPIPVTPGEWCLLSFWAKTAVTLKCPDVHLVGNEERSYLVGSDYPQLFSRSWSRHVRLYKPGFSSARLNMFRYSIGETWFDDFSLREVAIKPVVEVQGAGEKHYMLYYQPSEGSTYNIPSNVVASLPARTLTSVTVHASKAEKYLKDTQYTVASDEAFDLFFAESTVKIGPGTKAPSARKSSINISCAKNERQSFQLVLDPKAAVTVQDVTISNLTSDEDTVASKSCTLKRLEYVSMTRASTNRNLLVARLADPMVAFEPQELTGDTEPMALWFTLGVDGAKTAGNYQGVISISGKNGSRSLEVKVPINLRVYDFQLPERPAFRSIAGGTILYLVGPGGRYSPFDFHGISTADDKKTLARKYFAAMAEFKTYPQWPNLLDAVHCKFDPPPAGYNVDAPDNYFRLYDFNLEEAAKEIAIVMDAGKGNAFAVHHTNGDVCNILRISNGAAFGWGAGGHWTEITKDQYKHLIQDFYREIARVLQDRGWLDYAYIIIDETRNEGYAEKLHVFCEALKEDPLTARIKLVHTINNLTAFAYRSDPAQADAEYKGLIDIWAPENGQKYSGIADYYFPDANMTPADFESWRYYTRTAHLHIDTRGLSNRILPMKNYFMGSTGSYKWELIGWDAPASLVQNPWIDPYSYWGNGTVAFFYPPLKTGPAPAPDFTITPSVRLEMWREGVEDFDYMVLLDQLIRKTSEDRGDVAKARALVSDLQRMFHDQVHWSVNDEYYLRLRNEIAMQIERWNWF